MVQNPSLDELEDAGSLLWGSGCCRVRSVPLLSQDLAKKIYDYFQEEEIKRAVQTAEAVSAAGANSSATGMRQSHELPLN